MCLVVALHLGSPQPVCSALLCALLLLCASLALLAPLWTLDLRMCLAVALHPGVSSLVLPALWLQALLSSVRAPRFQNEKEKKAVVSKWRDDQDRQLRGPLGAWSEVGDAWAQGGAEGAEDG